MLMQEGHMEKDRTTQDDPRQTNESILNIPDSVDLWDHACPEHQKLPEYQERTRYEQALQQALQSCP